MPELAKWVNQHRYDGGGLSDPQKNCRAFYNDPCLRRGARLPRRHIFPLNPANNGNLQFGRTGDEPAGGHWLYAFLRHDPAGGQRFLVVVNLHKEIAFQNVRVLIPPAALSHLEKLFPGPPATPACSSSNASSNKMTLQKRFENFRRLL